MCGKRHSLPDPEHRAHVLVMPLTVSINPEEHLVLLVCYFCHQGFVILGPECFNNRSPSMDEILRSAIATAQIPRAINEALDHVLTCGDSIDDSWKEYEVRLNNRPNN